MICVCGNIAGVNRMLFDYSGDISRNKIKIINRYAKHKDDYNNYFKLGMSIGGGDIETSQPENWEPGLSINMKAPFYVTQQLLPLLKKRGASVVNVSSDGATISRAGASLYDATKQV